MNEERLNNVRKRLTPELEEIIRAHVASGKAPAPILGAFSSSKLERLTRDGAPLESATNVAALEAIVQRYGRPPLLVQNQKVVLEPLPAPFDSGIDGLIKGVEFRVASVGRIEFVNARMAWGGTGWVARIDGGTALVVTNRHVAKIVARRQSDGRGVFIRADFGERCRAEIDFNEEYGDDEDRSATFAVSGIRYLADDSSADVALLEVAADKLNERAPIELDDEPVKQGDLVALIGYPAYDSRNDASDQARYFRDIYEVKRFAPGFVTQAGDDRALMHDCTSLGGNSGSPLIRIGGGGKAVGLHFSGVYGVENSAIPARVVKALLDGERPTIVQVAEELATEGLKDSSHDKAHFEGREGFDPDFLGLATPWPKIADRLAGGLATPDPAPPEPNELRYRHFGVKYSAALKIPLLTAVNIDGQQSVRIKRGRDQWCTEQRIPLEVQLGEANFKDLEIDRGHMVRREDPNWSATGDQREAEQADNDTFHYVNAAAQHSRLNQGKQLWQGLENYILDSARTHGFRACVFTAPVIQEDETDRVIIDGALTPMEFWKVVVTLDEEGTALHATAYLLSQGQLIRKLLEDRSLREGYEGFELGAYRTFQVAISDLAQATGYNFSDEILAADPLRKAKSAQEALDAGEPVYLELADVSDVRL